MTRRTEWLATVQTLWRACRRKGKQAALWWSGQAYRRAVELVGLWAYGWAAVREGWWADVQAECCVVERMDDPLLMVERPNGRLYGLVVARTGD